MNNCPICNHENNDFLVLNDTAEYSGIEIAINRQGMLRVRCNWDSCEVSATEDIINIAKCPYCGTDMRKETKNDL